MNEVENLELVKEATKEIGKKIYEDTIKPIVKPTAEVIGMIPRAIKTALLPCEKWILNKEYNLAETKKLLEAKLKNVTPENIDSPEPYIAVPTLQYISYCMDNEELRDMYANLLASSMNKIVRNGVHPGFVEIIKQLSPDEAKILKYFSNKKVVPTITLRANNKKGEGIDVIQNFSNIGELVNCESSVEIDKYFDNLIRLGLIAKAEPLSHLVNNALYEILEGHTYIKTKIKEIEALENERNQPEIEKSYMKITSFGEQFCKICLSK